MTINEPRPRYRVTGPYAPMGVPYNVGSEIEVIDWPDTPSLEPINAAAKLVKGYPRQGRPVSLYNPLIGDLCLPAVPADGSAPIPHMDHSARLPNPTAESAATDDMPRYRSSEARRVGKIDIDAGGEFHFLGWPVDGFEPVNEAARLVAAYHEANRKNHKLLPAPWCLLRQKLVLPTLPELPKRNIEAEMEGTLAQAEDRAARAAQAQRVKERQRRSRSWEGITQ